MYICLLGRVETPMIYLDNSATTRPCAQAVEAIRNALCEVWYNPASLYEPGLRAERLLDRTRANAAGLLRCRPDEIYFTSGGTEANNLALFGAAAARKKRGNRIVTSAVEHPSVLEPARALEKQGFEVVFLQPGRDGIVPPQAICDAVTPDTILVSLMLVNNETGALQPVAAAAQAIRDVGAPALLHCDAVQAFGKHPISVRELGVDLLSASGHKIHAAKGVGLLYCAKSVVLPPRSYGGGQERGLRSGTEAVPLIAGLGAAIEALPDPAQQLPRMQMLNRYARQTLAQTGLITVLSPADASPYVLSLALPGYRSETLLHFLEAREIYVSSGSACAKGKPSHVLRAMGYTDREADSALRVSFSRENTEADVDALARALCDAAKKLRKR